MIVVLNAIMEEKSRDDLTVESSNQRQGVGQGIGDDSGQDTSSDDVVVLPSTAKRRLAEFPFPIKLHIVLGEIEDEGLSSIMSWQPDGKCFMIHKAKDVVGSVLSRWFRQQSIGSFQRQLNLYDFKRIKTGENKGAYFHELFRRDDRGLAFGIKRENLKIYKHDSNGQGTILEPRVIRSQNMMLGFTSIPRTTKDPQSFELVNNSQSSQMKTPRRLQFDNGGLHTTSVLGISQELMEKKQRTSVSLSFPTQVPGVPLGTSHESDQAISVMRRRRIDDSKNSLDKHSAFLSTLIRTDAALSPNKAQPRHLHTLPSSDASLSQSTRAPNFYLKHHQHNLQQGQDVVVSPIIGPPSKQQAQGLHFRLYTELFSPDVQDDIIETFLNHRHL